MAHSKQVIEEAIRLRVQEQLGLDSISERLGVAKGTLSRWLKEYPLNEDVVHTRMQENGKASAGRLKKYRGDESEVYRIVRSHDLNSGQIAKVAEAAVAFRLLTWGFNVFGSSYDGDRTDWLVEVPSTRKVWKVQVKTVQENNKGGLPHASLRHGAGSKIKYQRYLPGEFDFLVGYDIYTDIAYVWSWDEIAHLISAVTICPDAKERWDKLKEGFSVNITS